MGKMVYWWVLTGHSHVYPSNGQKPIQKEWHGVGWVFNGGRSQILSFVTQPTIEYEYIIEYGWLWLNDEIWQHGLISTNMNVTYALYLNGRNELSLSPIKHDVYVCNV